MLTLLQLVILQKKKKNFITTCMGTNDVVWPFIWFNSKLFPCKKKKKKKKQIQVNIDKKKKKPQ